MKNPYNDYTDKELCDIIQDIYESRSNGKRVESFVPYARELKDNINGSSEIITLRETLEMAKQDLASLEELFPGAEQAVKDFAETNNVSFESATEALQAYQDELEDTESAISSLTSASDSLQEALNTQGSQGYLTTQQTYELLKNMGSYSTYLSGALEKPAGGYVLNSNAQEILNQLLGDGNDEMETAIEMLLGGAEGYLENSTQIENNTNKVKENTEALDENNQKQYLQYPFPNHDSL